MSDDIRNDPAAEPGGEPAAEPAGSAGPADPGLLVDILEALVFAHRGILPARTVREVLGEEFSLEEIEAGFAFLRRRLEEQQVGAVRLHEVAGGWQLGTRPELAEWIQKLDFYENHRHLSRPTLETLAIIAYRQPVTRAEIEAIRGVNSERIVRNLLEKKLVRVLGHKDVPGRPMVLGTGREFLELFGLASLADLPPLKEFVEQPVPPDETLEEEPAPAPAGEPDAGGEPAPAQEEGADAEAEAPDAADEPPPPDAGEPVPDPAEPPRDDS